MLRQLALFLALGTTASTLHAQAPAPPSPASDQLHQWLEASARRSNLVTEGSQPFHLIATIEYFKDGQSAGKSNLEILWRDPLSYKETIIFPDRPKEPLTQVSNGKTSWHIGRWSFPFGVLNLEGLMLFPVPPEDISTHRLYLESQHAHIENLDCIAREPEIPGAPETLSIARTTYCLAKGNRIVRYIDTPKNIAFHLDDVMPFGNKYVARTLVMTYIGSSRPLARLHIDKLEALNDFSVLEEPSPTDAQIGEAHPLFTINRSDDGTLMPGQPLYLPPYDMETFMINKLDDLVPLGKMLLMLHVATDGTVASVDVLHSPDIHLNIIAIQWAKKARFRAGFKKDQLAPFDYPYLINFGGPDH